MDGKAYSSGLMPIAIAIVIAAAIFSSAFYFAAGKTALQSSEPKVRTISVSADAMREVAPNKAEITFAVYTRGLDPEGIQAENNEKMKKISEAIKALGIPPENIKTIGYTLDRYSEYNGSVYVEKGYQLTNTLRVITYDVTQAGKIVGLAVQNGANEVLGITFGISDEEKKRLYGLILQEAASSAKSKAEAMASSAGAKITGLVSMSEQYSYYPPIVSNYRFGIEQTAAKGDVEINSGLIKIAAIVQAQYEVAG